MPNSEGATIAEQFQQLEQLLVEDLFDTKPSPHESKKSTSSGEATPTARMMEELAVTEDSEPPISHRIVDGRLILLGGMEDEDTLDAQEAANPDAPGDIPSVLPAAEHPRSRFKKYIVDEDTGEILDAVPDDITDDTETVEEAPETPSESSPEEAPVFVAEAKPSVIKSTHTEMESTEEVRSIALRESTVEGQRLRVSSIEYGEEDARTYVELQMVPKAKLTIGQIRTLAQHKAKEYAVNRARWDAEVQRAIAVLENFPKITYASIYKEIEEAHVPVQREITPRTCAITINAIEDKRSRLAELLEVLLPIYTTYDKVLKTLEDVWGSISLKPSDESRRGEALHNLIAPRMELVELESCMATLEKAIARLDHQFNAVSRQLTALQMEIGDNPRYVGDVAPRMGGKPFTGYDLGG